MDHYIYTFYKKTRVIIYSTLVFFGLLLSLSQQLKAQTSPEWVITGPVTVLRGSTTTYSVPETISGRGAPSNFTWSLSAWGYGTEIITYGSTIQVKWDGIYTGYVSLRCVAGYPNGGPVNTSININVVNTPPPIVAGRIGPDEQTKFYNETAFLSGDSPTGGLGNYYYQWQKASTLEYRFQYFTNIPGATSVDYRTPELKDTTYYRRIDASSGGSGSIGTNTVVVNVVKPLTLGKVAPGAQSLFPGESLKPLNSAPAAGGNGIYVYQWQSSSDLNTWTNIANANTTTFNPTLISNVTYYRLAVTSNDKTVYSNVSGVYVYSCCMPNSNVNYISTSTFRQAGVTSSNISFDQIVNMGGNQTIQYFDGLGRPAQTVQVKASPLHMDIVTPIAYDQYGREAVKYLPYPSVIDYGGYVFSAIDDQAAFYHPVGSISGTQQANGIINTSSAYSVTKFEPSPLNRIKEQGAPGEVWQPDDSRTSTSGRTLVIEYKNNNNDVDHTVGGFAVRLYSAVPVSAVGREHERTLSNISGKLYYAANQLQVTISKDENWTEADGKSGTIEEYKDKNGRIVLKRMFNKNGASAIATLSTYYVYDDLGNLSFVLPPSARPDSLVVPVQVTLDNFCYQYRYDSRGRLIEKKIPGKGWEFMVYNKLNQLVASQDAVQRGKILQEWLFNKYDVFGRVIQTGIYTYPSSIANASYRTALQTIIDTQPSTVILWEERITTGTGYSNQCWPSTSVTTVLSWNYYDNYKIPALPAVSPYNLSSSYSNLSSSYSNMTRTLLTASQVNVLGTTKMLWIVNYYDSEARIVRSIKQHYKGGLVSNTSYDDQTNTYSFTDEVLTSNRRHFVNNVEQLYVANRFTYDDQGRPKDIYQKTGDNVSTENSEILLSRKNYNEIGQLTSKELYSENLVSPVFAQTVNYAYNPRGWLKSQSSPLFTQNLKYEDVIAGVTSQYNGNISRQEWGVGKYYNYGYDKLNRLNSALSNENDNELIGYDLMGNIKRLQRKRSGTLVDQMKYDYTDGNQLALVLDSNTLITSAAFQLPGTTAYSYDQNGNMTSRTNGVHAENNIIDMKYNELNLPASLNANGTMITYTYDAAGNKLRKQIASLNNDYISGIQYEGGILKYVGTAEGRVVRKGVDSYKYDYTLTDHLGNGRLYFDINSGIADPLQEIDYYAFGLEIEREVSSPPNMFMYNGKEKQEQEKMYNYGARFYDPVIGRFNVVDRFAEKYHSMSSYQYGANNPIGNIDINGDSIWYSINKNVVTMHMRGKVINGSNDDIDMKETVSDMIKAISDAFQGNFEMNGKDYVMKSDIKLDGVSSMDNVNSSDHLIVLADASGEKARGSTNEIGGKTIHVASSDYPGKGTLSGLLGWSNTRSTVHEVGHVAGLEHFKGFGTSNLMKQGVGGTSLNSDQMGTMYKNRGNINRGSNSVTNPYSGRKSPNPSLINYDINTRGYVRGNINNVGLRTKWTN